MSTVPQTDRFVPTSFRPALPLRNAPGTGSGAVWGADAYVGSAAVAEPVGGSAGVAAAPGLSVRDTEALVRAVAAEARGESPEVWVAVAQTIINYARKYGQSIPRLVRSSYLSSNYDHNKVYFTMPLSQIPGVDGMEGAVHNAALGRSPIGSRRVHFHDISISTPSFGNPSTATRIGRMVFFEPRH